MAELIAEPLSQIRPGRIRWLWEPYLPRGKLAVLDGDPGVGKSLLTTDLAARLSRGGPLPNGVPAGRPHVTLLLNAEDDPADTTRPRAEAAGADLDRVIVAAAPAGGPLSLPADLPALEALVLARSADLVVIDPLTAFLPPGVAATVDQCVRLALTPLTALATRTDCAVLLVRHLRKAGATRAVHRGAGSIGIIGAARTGLLAARDPSDPSRGVLAVTKANAADPAPSLGYRLTSNTNGTAVVEWLGSVAVTANALAADPEAPLRPRDRAANWLRAELASGPRPAAEVYAAAADAGIPDRTLERAKADVGVRSHQPAGKGQSEWYWYDPSAAWPAAAPFKKPREFELPPLGEVL